MHSIEHRHTASYLPCLTSFLPHFQKPFQKLSPILLIDETATSSDYYIFEITDGNMISRHNSSEDKKLLSFVEWDTDASFSNVNQSLAQTPATPTQSISLERAFNLLGHKNPKLRILELGNGSDDITRLVLKALTLQYGERLYSSYTYAATSFDASRRASEVFQETDNVEVTFYDAGRSSHSQSTKAGAYDLISKAGAYDLIITTDVRSPKTRLCEFPLIF